MGQSFNPEQLLQNIPPDVLKNFNPEMLKNFDMNKFNQLMKAFNGSNQSQGQRAGAPQNNSTRQTNYSSQPVKPSGGFDENQLKSLLTPEQLELFQSLRKTMKD